MTINKEFENGDKYEGEMNNGKMEGQGIYTFKNGERYEGEFKNDMFEGKGEYYWPDGTKKIGIFKKDKLIIEIGKNTKNPMIKIRWLVVRYIRLYGILTTLLLILGMIYILVSDYTVDDFAEYLSRGVENVLVLLIFFLFPALIQWRGEYIEDNLERKWRMRLEELFKMGLITEDEYKEEKRRISNLW